MTINDKTDQFLQELNKSCPAPTAGSFFQIDDSPDEILGANANDFAAYVGSDNPSEFAGRDILGVAYDYCSDDCDANMLNKWLYDVAWPAVRQWAYSHGYTVEAADHDGSGNGLYYGCTLFERV